LRNAVRTVQFHVKEIAMWYFAWILGIGVALGFGIVNTMWLDADDTFAQHAGKRAERRTGGAKDALS
jgi:cyd operon protein YbgT